MRLFSLPRINDISTDLDDPPTFREGSDKPCAGVSYPSSFKGKVREGYPDLAPLMDPRTPDEVFSKAVEMARQMDSWTVDHTDAESAVIEAVAVTSLMRFRDDIVIRITPTESGSRVDMRSRSRLGKHDLGANADRIQAFLQALRSA